MGRGAGQTLLAKSDRSICTHQDEGDCRYRITLVDKHTNVVSVIKAASASLDSSQFMKQETIWPVQLLCPCPVPIQWLGSRVVRMLDSGVERPGFKSQPRRCRVTVLGKIVHTHCAFVHQAAKLVAALLRVEGVTAGLSESNGSVLPGL